MLVEGAMLDGIDMDPMDSKSTEIEKHVVNTNYLHRLDSRLILLAFIVVCTAYVLGTFR